MAKFFKRKIRRPKKSKEEIKKEAEKIVANATERVDDMSLVNQVAKQTLIEAQDFITSSSDASRIAELSAEEKEKATELLRAIAKVLIESDKIPNETAGEFIKNLIQTDSKVVGVAVAEEASFIPDEQLKQIIGIPEVEVKDAERIIPGIEDEKTRAKVQEDLDLAKLQKLYLNQDISNDSEFINNLYRIKGKNIDSPRINEMLRKVVARRVAVYYSVLKAVTINRYTSIISPVQMLECDISKLAKREYEKLEVDGSEKEFDIKTCQTMVIDELAKELANQYFSQDPVNRTMILPESSAIRKLSEEEEEELINQLEIRCANKKEPLKKHQIQDIRNQIHGYVKTEEVGSLRISLDSVSNMDLRKMLATDFESILNMIQEFPEKEQQKIMSLLLTMTEKVTEKVKGMKSSDKAPQPKPSTFDNKSEGR